MQVVDRAARCVRACAPMKSSTMPDCSGPGRNSATSATMSSKQSGWSLRTRSFMPRDSSWKIAVVSQRLQQPVGRRRRPAGCARCRAAARPRRAGPALIALDGPVDDRQRAQAEEVELDQADRSTSSLSNCVTTLLAARFAVERREIGERARRDHDAAGVRAGVARQALELLRQIDQVADLVLGAVAPRELGLLAERIRRA